MAISGKVPAVYKCFSIINLLCRADDSPGVNEIARRLELNKGTVSNILRTLADLNVLEIRPDGKFDLGPQFYLLGKTAKQKSGLLQVAGPFLKRISQDTQLTAILGIRSHDSAVLVDKADATVDIKVSSEVGLQMPPLAGSGIKAMLSQLPDDEIDAILSRTDLKKYTPHSITDKQVFKKQILDVRVQKVAFDIEEYIEGYVCVAIPVKAGAKNIQAAIWALGRKGQMTGKNLDRLVDYLKTIEQDMNLRME